jgi:hypothetical protein
MELKDDRYNQLIVEVADPSAAVDLVKAAPPFLLTCLPREALTRNRRVWCRSRRDGAARGRAAMIVPRTIS